MILRGENLSPYHADNADSAIAEVAHRSKFDTREH
jgi:hypothetical protein